VKACGLIVEYNPFHNGHLYHVNEAKETTQADCMIAVMSGSFLQRGEPAIIDKFHRTKAALKSGVDLLVELPYAYAVQSSRYFAKGALLTLDALQTKYVCFGSESGDINQFYKGVEQRQNKKELYDETIQTFLQSGLSYPLASQQAYEAIGISELDLFQPNNILGFSYVNTIVEENLPIKARTIKRKSSHYHDNEIESSIASATSIRRELTDGQLSSKAMNALPEATVQQLENYRKKASIWHDWEQYFPLLYYRITTMTREELANIHGVDEGIEGRLINTIYDVHSFAELIKKMKTKRYTYVRLQRMFTHILTNTTKEQIAHFFSRATLPYVRLLGMTKRGQQYLNESKKSRTVPLVSNLNNKQKALYLDERALHVYYSILPVDKSIALRKQEFQLPIIL